MRNCIKTRLIKIFLISFMYSKDKDYHFCGSVVNFEVLYYLINNKVLK